MQISIIGTGNIGTALGSRWCEMGHKIIFGSRKSGNEGVKNLIKQCKDVTITSQENAALKSEIIVLAVPWSGVEQTLKNLGPVDGKIIIDCTNPLQQDLSLINIKGGVSGGEYIASLVPDARVVKAFNTTGAANMLNPEFGIEQATMFICGNDMNAKKTVKLLAVELGFEVIDAGSIIETKSLEYMAALWINLAYKQGLGHDIAFKLLKR